MPVTPPGKGRVCGDCRTARLLSLYIARCREPSRTSSWSDPAAGVLTGAAPPKSIVLPPTSPQHYAQRGAEVPPFPTQRVYLPRRPGGISKGVKAGANLVLT